jgi:hypothetical protein
MNPGMMHTPFYQQPGMFAGPQAHMQKPVVEVEEVKEPVVNVQD